MASGLKLLSADDVPALLADDNACCVSIYIDTSEFSHDPRHNQTKLKNLVRQAERELPNGTPEWFAPVEQLLETGSVSWLGGIPGVAIFLADRTSMTRALNYSPDDAAFVQRGFNLRPLVPALAESGRYYVLAIDPVEPRLYSADRHGIARVADDELSASLDRIREMTDFSADVGFHPSGPTPTTGGAATPKFHAQGESPEDYKQIQLDQFTLRLAQSVDDFLKHSQAPLILVSDPNLLGSYRRHAGYRQLAEQAVDKNPSGLSDEEIHRATEQIASDLLDEPRERQLARLAAVAGEADDYAGLRLESIIVGSVEGRVDTLFIADADGLYGTFDPQQRAVHLASEADDNAQDLLSFAVAQTLKNGGRLMAVAEGDLPGHADIAALLRY